jgi:hypothetical protein
VTSPGDAADQAAAEPPVAEPPSDQRGADAPPTASSSAEPGAADLPPSAGRPTAELSTGEAGRADARLTKSRPSPPPADPRADGRRTAAPLFGSSSLDEPTSGEAFGGDGYTAEAPAPVLVDDAPTEAFPVAAPASGRHRADPDEDADLVAKWRPPRQTSRVTMGLLAALLVALGFFAGVLVGRTAGTATSSGDTARPAATGAARPGPQR